MSCLSKLRPIVMASGLLMACACSPAAPQGEWVEVKRDDLRIEVEVTGALRAIDSDVIKPPSIKDMWQLKISMMAPDGSEIKKGEPLVAFDQTEVRRRLESKQASEDSAATQVKASRAQARVSNYDDELALAEARAQQRKAKLNADLPEGVIAEYKVKKAVLDLESADAQVAHLVTKSRDARKRSQGEVEHWENERLRAQGSVKSLTKALESLTVLAPRDGTVVYETDWNGEKASVGDQVWRSDTVLRVVSLDAMEALGEVDEVDSSQVAEGQKVALHLDSQPDTVLRGTVRSVSTMVKRQSPDNPLKVAELGIDLEPNDKLRLRPGMRFRGRVLTEKIEGTLLVPIGAVVPTAEGPKARVRDGSGSRLVSVKVGRRNGKLVEVLEGVAEGDELLVGGAR